MNRSIHLPVALLALTGYGLYAQPPDPGVNRPGQAPIIPLQAEGPPSDPAVAAPTQTAPPLLPPATPLLIPGGMGVEPQTLATRSTLTGDWWGARTRLEDRGVTFDGNITQFAFGQDGGITRLPRVPGVALPLQTGNRFEYTGRGDYALTFDLEKFGGLPKGRLLVRAQNWWGEYGNVGLSTGSLNVPIAAALLPPVPNDQGVPFITDFLLTQPLSKSWVVFAGKKNILGAADQDIFAGGDGTNQFNNLAFVGNPMFVLPLPYSSFTAGVVNLHEWGAVSAFVLDPQNRTKDFFRLDDLFSQGVIVGGEVKVRTNFLSKPGELHVGGIWKNVELTDLRFNEPYPGQIPQTATPGFATLRHSYAVYAGGDQYLRTYVDDPKKGWGVFARAAIGDENPSPIRYFLSAGIGGDSPIPSRRNDTFGIGWYYAGASRAFGPLPRALFGPVDGWGVELYYNVQLTPWMNLTPDFQIIQPGSRAIADTAYIGGVRLNLKF